MKTQIIQTTKTIILAFILTMGIGYVMAWTGPTSTAPNGNTPTPVNIGALEQIKTGGFGTYGNSYVGGTLGVGSGSVPISPNLKVDIDGNIGASGYCDQDGNNCKTINQMSLSGYYLCPVNVCDNNSASTCVGQVSNQDHCHCRQDQLINDTNRITCNPL